jgi:hypothetical protein
MTPVQKVFAERASGYKLVGDSRYIMLPQELYNDVIAWCRDNNIKATTVSTGSWSQAMFGVLLWKIVDDEQRLMFALRWGSQ